MNTALLAKIKWQARRGMLELDLILNRYIALACAQLTDAQLQALSRLLDEQDPDLYAWLMGQAIPETEELRHSVALIQASYPA